MNTIYVVMPGNVADPALPSGGNFYDRRVCQELPDAGWSVAELAVPGAWPLPSPADRAGLSDALATIPDGAPVLLDGLVGAAAPDEVVPESHRLRLALLVHLPLADETGLSPDVADALGQRERQVVHAAADVIATSHWAARRVAHLHDLPAARVQVAPPGVDPAPRAPGTDGRTQLLCVASVTPRKGHDVLVEALARVYEHRLHCLCVGAVGRTPQYAAQVRRSVQEHGLADRVRLAGPISDVELTEAYARADLVVLPSLGETYGMVVTEALARGIPVIASNVGGVPEALGQAPDGTVPGMLVPAGNADALTAALHSWLVEPQRRHRLRTAAIARRSHLAGWSATVTALSRILAAARSPA